MPFGTFCAQTIADIWAVAEDPGGVDGPKRPQGARRVSPKPRLTVLWHIGQRFARAELATQIEEPVITAAAAPGWISWADIRSGTDIARTRSASIARAGIG